MNKPLIIVTGATGKTGRAVVAQLRERDWPVRAIVRARDARSDKLDRLGAATPFVPGYDLARLDRRLAFPIAPAPLFAMQDERWKTDHDRQPLLRSATERYEIGTLA